MCVITAYGVQCLVAGCRGSGAGQQGVRPGRGMLHDAVVDGSRGRSGRGSIRDNIFGHKQNTKLSAAFFAVN